MSISLDEILDQENQEAANAKKARKQGNLLAWVNQGTQTLDTIGGLLNKGGGAPQPPPAKDNTALYVGIGLGVLVLILIAWYFVTKK